MQAFRGGAVSEIVSRKHYPFTRKKNAMEKDCSFNNMDFATFACPYCLCFAAVFRNSGDTMFISNHYRGNYFNCFGE